MALPEEAGDVTMDLSPESPALVETLHVGSGRPVVGRPPVLPKQGSIDRVLLSLQGNPYSGKGKGVVGETSEAKANGPVGMNPPRGPPTARSTALELIKPEVEDGQTFVDFLHRTWKPKGSTDILMREGRFFIAKFSHDDDMQVVMEGGPWLMSGRPIVLQQWTRDTKMEIERLETIPVWGNSSQGGGKARVNILLEWRVVTNGKATPVNPQQIASKASVHSKSTTDIPLNNGFSALNSEEDGSLDPTEAPPLVEHSTGTTNNLKRPPTIQEVNTAQEMKTGAQEKRDDSISSLVEPEQGHTTVEIALPASDPKKDKRPPGPTKETNQITEASLQYSYSKRMIRKQASKGGPLAPLVLIEITGPWTVGGNFNEVRYTWEKVGGRPMNINRLKRFND
ncbi:hypothetical protein QJS10_CPA07g00501 [Acorus calamus]|uniref:DUF4283 domain-containing protein n=1 Tax=Acorus calamus TaxID=4465 RepID=A0AAV9EG25_ACOCL|nr:hypothetical protein QJS10_CPA07g00501 [Acorus calamus]